MSRLMATQQYIQYCCTIQFLTLVHMSATRYVAMAHLHPFTSTIYLQKIVIFQCANCISLPEGNIW